MPLPSLFMQRRKNGETPATRLFSLYLEQCTRGLQGAWDRNKNGVLRFGERESHMLS